MTPPPITPTPPPAADAGLQPERTELAWRRTSLAIGVGSLVALRIGPDVAGSTWWLLPGFAGLIFAGALWSIAHSRGRAYARVLGGDRAAVPGGVPLAALMVFTVAVGLTALGLLASL